MKTKTLLIAPVLCCFMLGTALGQQASAQKGKPAPDFKATDAKGKEFKLSDRIGKEKHVILMFSRANW
ncbi:MAG: hypothetical protein AAF483_25405 [Planctomycetota bacterium]